MSNLLETYEDKFDHEPDEREIYIERQKIISRMSFCDALTMIFATLLLYIRILVDLYLAGLYLSKIDTNSIENEFTNARNAFGTFILILLPGLLNGLLNGLNIRYPEEWAGEFMQRVHKNELYSLPYYMPEDFTYTECGALTSCSNKIACGFFSCCLDLSEETFLRIMSVVQLRAAYDAWVSFVKLHRVTGGWRDAVMTSIAVHAVPQIFLQCWIFYFQDIQTTGNILNYEIDLLAAQITSITCNIVGVILAPNWSPLFNYAYSRPYRLNCCGHELYEGTGEFKVHDGEEGGDIKGDFDHDLDEEEEIEANGGAKGDMEDTKHGTSSPLNKGNSDSTGKVDEISLNTKRGLGLIPETGESKKIK